MSLCLKETDFHFEKRAKAADTFLYSCLSAHNKTNNAKWTLTPSVEGRINSESFATCHTKVNVCRSVCL